MEHSVNLIQQTHRHWTYRLSCYKKPVENFITLTLSQRGWNILDHWSIEYYSAANAVDAESHPKCSSECKICVYILERPSTSVKESFIHRDDSSTCITSWQRESGAGAAPAAELRCAQPTRSDADSRPECSSECHRDDRCPASEWLRASSDRPWKKEKISTNAVCVSVF